MLKKYPRQAKIYFLNEDKWSVEGNDKKRLFRKKKVSCH